MKLNILEKLKDNIDPKLDPQLGPNPDSMPISK